MAKDKVIIKFKAGKGKSYPDKYKSMDGKTEISCNLQQPKTCIVEVSEEKAFQILNDFPDSFEIVKGGADLDEKVKLHKVKETKKAAEKDVPTEKEKELIKGKIPSWNMKYQVLVAFADENELGFVPDDKASTQVNKSKVWRLIDEFIKKSQE